MKKFFQIFGAFTFGIITLVALTFLYTWFTFDHIENQKIEHSLEDGAKDAVVLITDVVSFDSEKARDAMEVETDLERLYEFLEKEPELGMAQKVGKPVFLNKVTESNNAHFHFVVPVQFENEVGAFWVHVVHSQNASKIRELAYN